MFCDYLGLMCSKLYQTDVDYKLNSSLLTQSLQKLVFNERHANSPLNLFLFLNLNLNCINLNCVIKNMQQGALRVEIIKIYFLQFSLNFNL